MKTHTFGLPYPGTVFQHSFMEHNENTAKLTIHQESIVEDSVYSPSQSITIYSPGCIKALRDELLLLYPL